MNRAERRIVLVSGAPRSGTTPIGHVLSLSSGAGILYEPMGTTGDRRFQQRFPMAGEPGFDELQLAAFINDMRGLRLSLKPQQRPAHDRLSWPARQFRNLIGSRSAISYRLLHLRPRLRTIIWKDPLAALSAPEVANAGVPVVITARAPLAHAASYARLGWTLDVAALYARYRPLHGAIAEVEQALSEPLEPVTSATILWHLVYRRAVAALEQHPEHAVLVDSESLERDEQAVYERLLARLRLERSARLRRYLAQRGTNANRKTHGATRVHDWSRPVSDTNHYWRDLLDPAQIERVHRLNGELWQQLLAHALLRSRS